MSATIEDVKNFWNSNPLFTGESKYAPGTKEFYEEHRQVCIEDCYAGRMNPDFFPEKIKNINDTKILDLGCGVGFWLVELSCHYPNAKIYGADLSDKSIEISKRRCEIYGIEGDLSIQNAESLTFNSNFFDHVNCQGVIHHTPNTDKAIMEIARVLKKGGTASISVYYNNWILKSWKWVYPVASIILKYVFKFKGRGREEMYLEKDIKEIVRQYDGKSNPIGKAYSNQQFLAALEPYFHIRSVFFHFFPARAIWTKTPKVLHKVLERLFPFMIYVQLEKK